MHPVSDELSTRPLESSKNEDRSRCRRQWAQCESHQQLKGRIRTDRCRQQTESLMTWTLKDIRSHNAWRQHLGSKEDSLLLQVAGIWSLRGKNSLHFGVKCCYQEAKSFPLQMERSIMNKILCLSCSTSHLQHLVQCNECMMCVQQMCVE